MSAPESTSACVAGAAATRRKTDSSPSPSPRYRVTIAPPRKNQNSAIIMKCDSLNLEENLRGGAQATLGANSGIFLRGGPVGARPDYAARVARLSPEFPPSVFTASEVPGIKNKNGGGGVYHTDSLSRCIQCRRCETTPSEFAASSPTLQARGRGAVTTALRARRGQDSGRVLDRWDRSDRCLQ